ncbi:MAG: hypothetical protein Q4G11_04030, partial [Gallicola sp.]|nr:hypothetical protein [Gallicola sp.]
VLVNNKTHFGVGIYQFKRKDLKSISEKVWTAIENTLLAAGYNPEIVDEYMRQAGEIHFAKNNNRRASAWVTKVAEYCYIYIGDEYLDVDEMYRDTIGVVMSDYLYTSPVNPRDYCFVNEEMPRALSELTGLPAFK